MKVTEKDMETPGFWSQQRFAERTVHGAFAAGQLAGMTDREAKAVSDAVEALTKALLVLGKVKA